MEATVERIRASLQRHHDLTRAIAELSGAAQAVVSAEDRLVEANACLGPLRKELRVLERRQCVHLTSPHSRS